MAFFILNNRMLSVNTTDNSKKNNPFESKRIQPSKIKLTINSATTIRIALNRRLFRYSARRNFTSARYFYLIDNLTYNFIGRYALHFFVGCQHYTMTQHRQSNEFNVFRCNKVTSID